MNNKKLLIAGGGTGGHVLAGVAIADQWLKTNPQGDVLFVGSSQGLESKLVPKAGYKLHVLPVGALNQVSFITRIKTLFILPLTFLSSFIILLKFRPDAVIGVGGYASGPVVLIAGLFNRLTFGFFPKVTSILEQNLVPGFTNRKLAPWVSVVFCAFKEAQENFPGIKCIESGNPIRSSLKRLPMPTHAPFTLFVFGGSQGAMGVNTMIIDALPFLKGTGIHIIHQTGPRDFERVQAAYNREQFSAKIEKFIDDMAACYLSASLIICRAGASSMAELASVGRAALFIPLPTASDNHQEKNATVYSGAGAAQIIKQGSMTGKELAEKIIFYKNDPNKIETMINAVVHFHKPDAALSIVQYLVQKSE